MVLTKSELRFDYRSRMVKVRCATQFFRALPLSIFEQPKKLNFSVVLHRYPL